MRSITTGCSTGFGSILNKLLSSRCITRIRHSNLPRAPWLLYLLPDSTAQVRNLCASILRSQTLLEIVNICIPRISLLHMRCANRRQELPAESDSPEERFPCRQNYRSMHQRNLGLGGAKYTPQTVMEI